jgi:hypothetical protein
MRQVVAAQARRVERMSKDAPPGAPLPVPLPPVSADRPPLRTVLVSDYMTMGMGREQAEQTYDRQLAAWEARRGNA